MKESLGAARTALGRPALRRALLAFLTFAVAEWATWVAVLVWAYERGGVGGASAVSIAQLVPAVVVAPFASTLGDRLPRGQALALGYLLQGVAMLGTALAVNADPPLAVVAVCGAVLTSAITLTRPVHHAALPSLASTPAELVAANAASTTAEGVGAFLGPLACGLLINGGGAQSVLGLFGVLLLAAAMSVARLPVARTAAEDAETAVRGALAGLRELSHDPPAAVLLLMVAGQYVVIGAMDILLMVVAFDLLGTDSSGPGLLASAFGVGSVLGGLATVVLVGRRRLAPALGTGLLVAGLPLALLPLGMVPASAAALLAVSGAGKSFFDVAGLTLLQRAVPDAVLARVFGVQESVMTAALAAGAALAPAAVAALGHTGALVATGALLPVAGLLSWRWLRRLDRTALQPGPHLALLRGVPTLRGAGLPVLERLSRRVGEVDLPAGADVVRQGEPGDVFFVVIDGELTVRREGNAVRRLGPGASFGEIALLRGGPRTATVHTETPARLVTLARDDFLRAVTSTTATLDAARGVAADYLAEDEIRSGVRTET